MTISSPALPQNGFNIATSAPPATLSFDQASISTSATLAPSLTGSATASSSNTIVNQPGAVSSIHDHLRDLFQKRLHSLTYLKRSLSSKQSWFNTIQLGQQELHAAFDQERMRKRSVRFTLLGLSLSNILELNNPNDMSRAIISLINELESCPDDAITSLIGGGNVPGSAFGTARPKMKNLFKSSTKTLKRSAANQALNDFSAMDGSTPSANGMGIGGPPSAGGNSDKDSSYLVTPNIPFQLDFFQTFFTLCDILCEVYHKMISFLYSGGAAAAVGIPLSMYASQDGSATTPTTMATTGTMLPVASGLSSPLGSTAERDRATSVGSASFSAQPFTDNLTFASLGHGFGPASNFVDNATTLVNSISSSEKSNGISAITQELMLKADAKIKKTISVQIKQIDNLARQLIKDELASLDPMLKDLGISTTSHSSFIHQGHASQILSSPTERGSGLPAGYGNSSPLPFSFSSAATSSANVTSSSIVGGIPSTGGATRFLHQQGRHGGSTVESSSVAVAVAKGHPSAITAGHHSLVLDNPSNLIRSRSAKSKHQPCNSNSSSSNVVPSEQDHTSPPPSSNYHHHHRPSLQSSSHSVHHASSASSQIHFPRASIDQSSLHFGSD